MLNLPSLAFRGCWQPELVMNDLALVAEKLGIDIANVRHGIAADTRIGASYLSPGVGLAVRTFRMIF